MADTQNTVALVYAYDQTLIPRHMRDGALFSEAGMNPKHTRKKSDFFLPSRDGDKLEIRRAPS